MVITHTRVPHATSVALIFHASILFVGVLSILTFRYYIAMVNVADLLCQQFVCLGGKCSLPHTFMQISYKFTYLYFDCFNVVLSVPRYT